MKIEYRDGLLFTTIEIWYEGKSKVIDNIVIDTGASKSIAVGRFSDDIIGSFFGVLGSFDIAVYSFLGIRRTLSPGQFRVEQDSQSPPW